MSQDTDRTRPEAPLEVEQEVARDPAARQQAAEEAHEGLKRAGVEAPPPEAIARDLREKEGEPGALRPEEMPPEKMPPEQVSPEALAAAAALPPEERITAKATRFGYTFYLPDRVIKEMDKSRDVFAAFMAFGGSLIWASGGTLAPLVAIVAGYVALQMAVIRRMNKGRGVRLKAWWIAPHVLFPKAL